MKIVIVDDEKFAINYIINMIKEIGDYNIIATFTDPLKALSEINKLDVNLLFLDVEMPGINGFQLAKEIKRTNLNIHIVFLSAYAEYAVEAFEINATHYLLKPIQKKNLKESIFRVKSKLDKQIDSTKVLPLIRCFGSVQFVRDQHDFKSLDVKWRTMISKEIFCYLLYYEGRSIKKESLTDLFWSGHDPKVASNQLYTAIYHIRKLLEGINFPITIENTEFGYKLELNGVKIDTKEWERQISQFDIVNDDNYKEVLKKLKIYTSPYLSDSRYSWIELEQQRLKMIWSHNVRKIANYLLEKQAYSEAILLYLDMQSVDPLAEELYFDLMKLYLLVGDRLSVELQFNKLTEMLKVEYGLYPNDEVLKWYNNWLAEKSY